MRMQHIQRQQQLAAANLQQQQQMQQQQMNNEMQRGGPPESYDGLMTKKDKDWIIKIQLMQLNTDNPYTHDYYHMVCLFFNRSDQGRHTCNGADIDRLRDTL